MLLLDETSAFARCAFCRCALRADGRQPARSRARDRDPHRAGQRTMWLVGVRTIDELRPSTSPDSSGSHHAHASERDVDRPTRPQPTKLTGRTRANGPGATNASQSTRCRETRELAPLQSLHSVGRFAARTADAPLPRTTVLQVESGRRDLNLRPPGPPSRHQEHGVRGVPLRRLDRGPDPPS